MPLSKINELRIFHDPFFLYKHYCRILEMENRKFHKKVQDSEEHSEKQ